MKKLYEENPLRFSLLWVILYVALLSLAENVSHGLGTEKLLTAPLCVLMTAFLAVWISKNGLAVPCGLCAVRGKAASYWYFLPLVLLASVNLWNGLTMNFSALESALYAVSRLCVGFLEEILFRGFLFRALRPEGLKKAVLISSLTFGIGHIVNLLNGAPVLSTLLQVCYACAIGFLFTILFLRSGSLVPCILTHSAVNILSAFAVQPAGLGEVWMSAAVAAIALGYSLALLRTGKAEIPRQPPVS